LQQLGFMSRSAILTCARATLAGCYNPRFPSDSSAAPQNTQQSDARDRRDSAAGSGASVRPN
jgi:hypothetical protein